MTDPNVTYLIVGVALLLACLQILTGIKRKKWPAVIILSGPLLIGVLNLSVEDGLISAALLAVHLVTAWLATLTGRSFRDWLAISILFTPLALPVWLLTRGMRLVWKAI